MIYEQLKQNAMIDEAIASAELANTTEEWEKEFNILLEDMQFQDDTTYNEIPGDIQIKNLIMKHISKAKQEARNEAIDDCVEEVLKLKGDAYSQGASKTFTTYDLISHILLHFKS